MVAGPEVSAGGLAFTVAVVNPNQGLSTCQRKRLLRYSRENHSLSNAVHCLGRGSQHGCHLGFRESCTLQSERELGHTSPLETRVSLAPVDGFSPGWPSRSRRAHVRIRGSLRMADNIFPRFKRQSGYQ